MGGDTSPKVLLKMGLYYHPPDQTTEAYLEMQKELSEVTKADNVVILGDFSYPCIDWINMCSSNGVETRFLYIINVCTAEQLVTEPTRVIVILDLVLNRV